MWLVYPVAAAMAGILIWALNRDPSWASKLNTLLTARQYWHSFNFKELMFLGLGGVVIVALIFLRINGYFADRREKLEQKAAAAWNRSLAPLVDISDYPDRDDLYFYLETGDRPRLLDALRRMPRGSRSLRAAVAAIDPDLLDEPA
ncbi:MAG TPA: hypothetical protein VK815_09095 [Candidatus Acidoferrales bacterium]|nr:hypothetical protein [Candidatus Acidoferrales bacterium]